MKSQATSPQTLVVERCNNGEPILAPTDRWWETGVTFNAAALYLERSPANDPIIQGLLPGYPLSSADLSEGIVVVHYRARPETEPGSNFVRSFIGLAVFTPAFKLLYRSPEPVLAPDAAANGIDPLGVEDPRITRFSDAFYMVYCGVTPDPLNVWHASLCLARSTDLIHWEKLGPLAGDINRTNNKDGILFPHPIGGKYYLLHRPFWNGLPLDDFAIHLAVSDSLNGDWQDCGEVLHSFHNPQRRQSWVGGGSVPIPMGAGRYAEIYHTGNFINEVDREYDLDAAVFDFNALNPQRPASIVTARLEHLMIPETPAELRSHSALMVGNVLFACGSYEYQHDIYIIYGGADTYTLAARVNKLAFFEALEHANLDNPFHNQ